MSRFQNRLALGESLPRHPGVFYIVVGDAEVSRNLGIVRIVGADTATKREP